MLSKDGMEMRDRSSDFINEKRKSIGHMDIQNKTIVRRLNRLKER